MATPDIASNGPAQRLAARPGIDDFMRGFNDRLQMTADAESEIRRDMRSDFRFFISKQWDSDVLADRDQQGKPTLTLNRLPAFVKQVTNQQRAQRSAVQVTPLRGGTVATAEIFQGIIRNIEMNSSADAIYTKAGEHQAIAGRGYWRILTEYAEDDGFNQVITIRPINDPMTVYMDPSHQLADASDANFCIILEDITKDEFIRRFGADEFGYWEFFVGMDKASDWMPVGRVRIAEYFYKDKEQVEVAEVLVPTDRGPQIITMDANVLPKEELMLRAGWRVRKRKTVTRTVIKWALVTPYQILEGNETKTSGRLWPGRYIPVVQVLGDQLTVDGETTIRGIVRDAKDPQRMYSFWGSSLTEIVAQAPRAPYIGVEGQFKGHEHKWNTAGKKAWGYLEYTNVDLNGKPAPPPQRNQFDPNIASVVEAFQLMSFAMEEIIGLYKPSLGGPGPEQSGRAILARQKQGDVGNANYIDNWNQAIRYGGRILVDLIPKIYDAGRIERIIGADDQPREVLVHGMGAEKTDLDILRQMSGIEQVFDLSVGRYDIAVGVGAMQTRRQEAVDALLQLAGFAPQIIPLIGDLLVGNMDWPGAARIQARLKSLVPPEVLAAENGEQVIPPAIQAQMQALTQQVQELQKLLETDAIKTQAQVQMKKMDIDADAKKTAFEAKIDILLEQIKAQNTQNIESLKANNTKQIEGMKAQFNQALELLKERHEVAGRSADATANEESEARQAAMEREAMEREAASRQV